MTNRTPRSPTRRTPRVRAAGVLVVLSLVAMMALAPGVMAGGTVTVVTAIPGGGWINSLDNTGGGSTALVAGPGPGTLGTGSLALTIATNADFAGVEHPYLPAGIAFADLTAASWRTFVTGATGNPDAEPAALKFSGYQDGVFPFNGFTTLVVELVYNVGATPNVWQDNVLADSTTVWQTNTDAPAFCTDTMFCTFAQFKAQYPTARFFGVHVGLGTGVPAVTSYADGVSVTTLVNGLPVTESWDFEVAGAPVATPAASIPNASMAASSAQPGSPLVIVLGSLTLLSALAIAMVQRRRISR